MPLSDPAPREPIHERRVTCRGWRRTDGLWDIEGHLVDEKAYPFRNAYRGRVAPGQPVHEMWLRLTLDDSFTVQSVEAVTEHGPYEHCGAVTPAFQQLVGLTIGPGWTRAVKARLGGPRGCTHLVELLGPMATTAFQTIYPILARERDAAASSDRKARPPLLNTCHIYASDGAFVRRHWPEHYTGPDAGPGNGGARMTQPPEDRT